MTLFNPEIGQKVKLSKPFSKTFYGKGITGEIGVVKNIDFLTSLITVAFEEDSLTAGILAFDEVTKKERRSFFGIFK